MSLKDVLDRFALVSGLDQEEVSDWTFVIIDCMKYFESKVNCTALSDVEYSRVVHACAVYAYYKYTLMNFASLSNRFKAGDVEYSRSESLTDSAHTMWQHEKNEIADIIDFDGVCFCGVGA